MAEEYVDVKIVTDESGLITLNDLPLGTYYIKELIAPPTYALSDEVIKVSLTTEQKDTMIFQGVVESEPIEAFLTKTDAFTGEEIPNCKFEITDVDGNVIFSVYEKFFEIYEGDDHLYVGCVLPCFIVLQQG